MGGERVTNPGEKKVAADDSEGNLIELTFQCTFVVVALSLAGQGTRGTYFVPTLARANARVLARFRFLARANARN